MSSANQLHSLTTTIKIGADDVSEFVALFAYAGFNPEMIHEHFLKITKDKGISDDVFLKDLKTLIVLGAMKGNYTMKNSGKISEDGKNMADKLYATYQLKKGSVGTDKKSITLPRILSAFPEITTRIVLKCPDKNYGSRTNGLSKFMKNPVFAAMVPTTLDEAVRKFFLELYNVYSAEQTMVISKEANFEVAKKAQQQYTDIAHGSSVPDEKTRVSFFKAMLVLLKEDVVNGASLVDETSRISTQQLETALLKLGKRSTDTLDV